MIQGSPGRQALLFAGSAPLTSRAVSGALSQEGGADALVLQERFSVDRGPLPRGTLHLLAAAVSPARAPASSVWHSYRVKFSLQHVVGTGSGPGKHLRPLVLCGLWVSLRPPGLPTAPLVEK